MNEISSKSILSLAKFLKRFSNNTKFSFLFIIISCRTLPPSAYLNLPSVQVPMSQTIVIEKVTIDGLSDRDKHSIEEKLTLYLKYFLLHGNYFNKTYLYNEKNMNLENYKILQFHFSNYTHNRAPYLWSLPFTVFTMYLYLWFKGTIFVDTIHFNCTLNVKDEQNKIIYQIQKELKEERRTNIFTRADWISISTDVRTKLIEEILEEYRNKTINANILDKE